MGIGLFMCFSLSGNVSLLVQIINNVQSIFIAMWPLQNFGFKCLFMCHLEPIPLII